MDKVSMPYLISFSGYLTKGTTKFLFRQTSKAMADSEKKEGKTEKQKFEYLKNEKSFLDDIKKIFHSF